MSTKTYNIKKRYNYFNKKYFNGDLPNDFKFRWSRSKTELGAVVYHISSDNSDDWEIFRLSLSNFYDVSHEDLDGTLLHEMLHVLNYYNNVICDIDPFGWRLAVDTKAGHHKEFRDLVDKYTKITGLDIDYEESSKVYNIRHTGRRVGVIICQDTSGTHYIANYKESLFDSITTRSYLVRQFSSYKGLEVVYCGVSDNPRLLSYVISNKLIDKQPQQCPSSLAETIIDSSLLSYSVLNGDNALGYMIFDCTHKSGDVDTMARFFSPGSLNLDRAYKVSREYNDITKGIKSELRIAGTSMTALSDIDSIDLHTGCYRDIRQCLNISEHMIDVIREKLVEEWYNNG